MPGSTLDQAVAGENLEVVNRLKIVAQVSDSLATLVAGEAKVLCKDEILVTPRADAKECAGAWTTAVKHCSYFPRSRRGGHRVHLRPLASNPQRVGEALRLQLEGRDSGRRVVYRISCRIDERVTITALSPTLPREA